jgi:hypothetical protein
LAHTLKEQIRNLRAFFSLFLIQQEDPLASKKRRRTFKNTLKYLEPNQTKSIF